MQNEQPESTKEINVKNAIHASLRNLVAASSLVVLGACASAPSAVLPAKTSDGMLTSFSGMTLYVYDKDTAGSGKSACNGPCAANWPPLMAEAEAKSTGDYSLVARDDGGRQWAYKGRPLYFWVKDTKPGDKTGDGFKDVWHIVRP